MDSKHAAAEAVAYLSATYAAKFPVNSHTVPAWVDQLQDVPAAEIELAIRAWCRENTWPPVPAEIRSRCPSLCRCGSCDACSRRRRAIDAAQDDQRAIRFAEHAKMLRASGEWERLHRRDRENLEAWERRASLVLEARKAAPQLAAPERRGMASFAQIARSVRVERES